MNTGCSVKNFTFAADSENESATKKVYKRKVAKRKLQRSHAKPNYIISLVVGSMAWHGLAIIFKHIYYGNIIYQYVGIVM